MDNHLQNGGNRSTASTVSTAVVHPRYQEAREKAFQLETTIETAQKQYAKQLSQIIKKLQRQFYQQYGATIQELEDLEDGISNIQYKGLKTLKRRLTQLYLESSDDQIGGGGQEQEIRKKAKQLYQDYKATYQPHDNYQKKRDVEAKKLQMAIMGSMGGGSSGMGSMGSMGSMGGMESMGGGGMESMGGSGGIGQYILSNVNVSPSSRSQPHGDESDADIYCGENC
jgi:hypothetical protein